MGVEEVDAALLVPDMGSVRAKIGGPPLKWTRVTPGLQP